MLCVYDVIFFVDIFWVGIGIFYISGVRVLFVLIVYFLMDVLCIGLFLVIGCVFLFWFWGILLLFVILGI